MADEVERLREIIRRQTIQLQDFEGQNGSLAEDLREMKEGFQWRLSEVEERHKREIDERDAEIEALTQELEANHIEIHDLKTKLKKHGDCIETERVEPCCSWGRLRLKLAHREIEELLRNLSVAEKKLGDYELKIDDMQQELQEQYSLIYELENTVMTQDEDDAFVQEQFEKVFDERDDLSSEVDQLQSELASAEEKLDEFKELYYNRRRY